MSKADNSIPIDYKPYQDKALVDTVASNVGSLLRQFGKSNQGLFCGLVWNGYDFELDKDGLNYKIIGVTSNTDHIVPVKVVTRALIQMRHLEIWKADRDDKGNYLGVWDKSDLISFTIRTLITAIIPASYNQRLNKITKKWEKEIQFDDVESPLYGEPNYIEMINKFLAGDAYREFNEDDELTKKYGEIGFHPIMRMKKKNEIAFSKGLISGKLSQLIKPQKNKRRKVKKIKTIEDFL